MLAWDSEAEMWIEFGHNKTVANEQNSGECRSRWLCLVIFDVLYVKGGREVDKIVQESLLTGKQSTERNEPALSAPVFLPSHEGDGKTDQSKPPAQTLLGE